MTWTELEGEVKKLSQIISYSPDIIVGITPDYSLGKVEEIIKFPWE